MDAEMQQKRISDLDNQILVLTWERVSLDKKESNQKKWEDLMSKIEQLTNERKSLQLGIDIESVVPTVEIKPTIEKKYLDTGFTF